VVPESLDARALLDDGEAFAAGPGLSGEAKKAVVRARTVVPPLESLGEHGGAVGSASADAASGERRGVASGTDGADSAATSHLGKTGWGESERSPEPAESSEPGGVIAGAEPDTVADADPHVSFGDFGDFGDFDDEGDDLGMAYIIDEDDDEDPDDPEVRARDADVRSELTTAVGVTRATRLAARLSDATRSFKREQFDDAARTLRKLADEAPTAMAVRELYGLTLYRQGKWRQAAKELEAFRAGSGSADQNPVLADCYRALKRWQEVEELWIELKEASPSVELVIEGRIVAAAAKADRGELRDAMNLLQQGWKLPKRPEISHLRRGYALADLYERAGELAKARELFGWVATQMPDFADAKRRARQLR